MTTYVDLDTALTSNYPFAAIPLPGGDGWEIVFPDIPGVIGFAETWDAIGNEAHSILAEWLTIEDEDGRPLPAPDHEWTPVSRNRGDFDVPRLHSAEDAATALGISRRRVTALARSRQVGSMVGNSLVFTDRDIDAMRERTPGRPASDPSAARQAS